MMQRATAAHYCDMSPADFEREVAGGRLPEPVLMSGGERWSRRAIDACLERLSGEVPDWRAQSKLYAQG